MVCTFPLTVPIAQTQTAVAEWRLHYSCDSIALAKGHSQLSEENYAIKRQALEETSEGHHQESSVKV